VEVVLSCGIVRDFAVLLPHLLSEFFEIDQLQDLGHDSPPILYLRPVADCSSAVS
jgi:hypothetical protein